MAGGELWAAWRQGLKELGQALVALPTSNIRPVEELGGIGNPTQMEVNQEGGGYDWRQGCEPPQAGIQQEQVVRERNEVEMER